MEMRESMDMLTSNSLLMMERSMDFLWTKQTAILDNLSNVETPNYKTKYVTFEETLRSRLQSAVPSGGKRRAWMETVWMQRSRELSWHATRCSCSM